MSKAEHVQPRYSGPCQARCDAIARPTWQDRLVYVMDISLDASPDHQTLKYEDWFASLDGHGLSHQPLPPQQANSARLFFCPEKSVALNVFKHIGDGEMAAAFELPNYKTGDVPYNIPTLMSWLSLAPDKNVQFGVSELLGSKTKNNDTCALQHQIYLQRREENRYEVVWYTLIDKRLFGDAIYEDLASRTRLQTSFVDYVKSGKAPLACALPAPIDFTLSMMLTILEIDISHFESFFKNWRTTVDVEPLIGEKPQMYKTLPFLLAGEPEETVLDNAVSQRSLYFKVYRRMIFKAEDLLECLVSKPLQDALISKHPAACSPVQQVSAGLEQRAAHLLKYSKRMDQSEEALLGLQRNEAYMKQSTNINALTVVACMFLPVTLSSAMLGMEFTFAALEKRRIADMACLAAIIMICSSFLWAISRGWTRIKRELMVESLIPAHGKDLYWVISFVGLLSIGVGCICILDGGTRAGMPLVVGGLSILLIAPLLVNLILPMRSWEWGLFLRAFGAKRKKHDRQPGETATVEETA